MAKLYFRYGTMGSSKSLDLLTTAYNYEDQNKGVLVYTSGLDTRSGLNKIVSRAGLSRSAKSIGDTLDISEVREDIHKYESQFGNQVKCILVDECQLLSSEVIDTLADIVVKDNIPVLCYGLRTDYTGHLFEGSKRLLELAHSIEEIKTTCVFCNKKATLNLRVSDGKPVYTGEQIIIGDSEYMPVCLEHYQRPELP